MNQEDQPPASIPSTLAPLEACPQCQQKLAPPKASGRQVCVRCGWANKPRSVTPGSTQGGNGTDADIMRLLEQAASESMANMQPRKQSK